MATNGEDRRGGIAAASGFRYQYLKTIETMFDLHDQRNLDAVIRSEDTEFDAVDYSVSDSSGRVLLASQVKSAIHPTNDNALRPLEAVRILCRLAGSGAGAIRIETNRPLSRGTSRLADDLSGCSDADQLVSRIRNSPYYSEAVEAVVGSLDDDSIQLLGRASISHDPRPAPEIIGALSARITGARRDVGLGVGVVSAGLLVDRLVARVFELSSNPQSAAREMTVAHFRELLVLPDFDLAESAAAYDWQIPVGWLPQAPSVDRSVVLSQIGNALTLSGGGRRPTKCVLIGLSGIGKSSIVAGYAHKFGGNYDRIVWVDCSAPELIRQGMTALLAAAGRRIGTTDVDRLSDQALTESVREHLARSVGTWLMVLDGVVAESDIGKWLPAVGQVAIVATSTAQQGWHEWERISISEMTLAEARELIIRRLSLGTEQLSSAQEGMLGRLVEATKLWPLAIELACAYLRESGRGLSLTDEYLKLIADRIYDATDLLPSRYPRTLAACVRIAVEAVRAIEVEENTEVRPANVLDVLAYFPPEAASIRAAIVAAKSAVEAPECSASLHLSASPEISEVDIDDCFHAIGRSSLVKRIVIDSVGSVGHATAFARMNEIVQYVLRRIHRFEDSTPQILIGAQDTLSRVLSDETNRAFGFWFELAPSVHNLMGHCVECSMVTLEGVTIIGNLGELSMLAHRFGQAHRHFEVELALLAQAGRAPRLERKILGALTMCAVNMDLHPIEILAVFYRFAALLEEHPDSQPDEPELDRTVIRVLDAIRVFSVSEAAKNSRGEISSLVARIENASSVQTGSGGIYETSARLRELILGDDDQATIRAAEEILRQPDVPEETRWSIQGFLIEAYWFGEDPAAVVGQIDRVRESFRDAGIPITVASTTLSNVHSNAASKLVWEGANLDCR